MAAQLRYFADPRLIPLAVPLETLDLDPDNELDHTAESVQEIVKLLIRFGWREPVGALKSRKRVKLVTRGNRTLMAARWLAEAAASEDPEMRARAVGHESWWSSDEPPDWLMVPALFFADDAATRVAWRISHNKSAEAPAWDWGVLADNMAEVSDEVDWGELGWSAEELAELFEPDEPEPTPEDPPEPEEPPIPEPPVEPVTKRGEVIQLGPHVLHCEDCMVVMAGMADNSVDFIGTDGPYGLSPDGKARTWDEIEVLRAEGKKTPNSGFMSKTWDAGVPGLKWARECLRILKPGGHLVSFSATRTYHRHGCAVEDAGFEIRDMWGWQFYSGFPKSLNVSKAIDEAMGLDRGEVIGASPWSNSSQHFVPGEDHSQRVHLEITAPASDLAALWDGFGTSLKPANEPAVVARKPLDSIAPAEVADLLGQPHMWSRTVPASPTPEPVDTKAMAKKRAATRKRWGADVPEGAVEWRGRPLLPDVEGRLELRVGDEVIASLPGPKYSKAAISTVAVNVLKWGTGAINIDAGRFADGDPAWPGPSEGEAGWGGGAAFRHTHAASAYGGMPRGEARPVVGRWPANIYATPKPATSEKDAGCEDFEETDGNKWNSGGIGERRRQAGLGMRRNAHPTVKPRRLFSQILRLFCPPGGTAFEPFGGSGTTLVAACGLDCKVIACELDEGYCDIIRARGEWALEPGAGSPPRKPGKRRKAPEDGNKRQARRRVQTLIQSGKLKRPEDLTCVDCEDAPGREYDHHLGYGAAHHEHVEALCASCHHAREAERAKSAPA